MGTLDFQTRSAISYTLDESIAKTGGRYIQLGFDKENELILPRAIRTIITDKDTSMISRYNSDPRSLSPFLQKSGNTYGMIMIADLRKWSGLFEQKHTVFCSDTFGFLQFARILSDLGNEVFIALDVRERPGRDMSTVLECPEINLYKIKRKI